MTPEQFINQAYQDPLDITAWLLDPASVAEELSIINQSEEK